MALLLKQMLEQLGTLKNQSSDSVTLVVILSMFLSFSLVITSMMGGLRPAEPNLPHPAASPPASRSSF